MSNHFHAILTTPNANLDVAMRYLLRESNRRINSLTHRINHLYGGPYRWTLLENRFSYEVVSRYVYQNPLVKGMCERVEDYEFSTLYYQKRSLELPMKMELSCFEAFEYPLWTRLDWLNENRPQRDRDSVRRALRYSTFNPKKDHRARKNHPPL